MLLRRGHAIVTPKLTAGPGLVTLALGITKKHYGTHLTGDTIWLEDRGELITTEQLIASPRVGVDYAGADASLPWRFRLAGSRWTSKAK